MWDTDEYATIRMRFDCPMHTHAPYARLDIPRNTNRGVNTTVDAGKAVTATLRKP